MGAAQATLKMLLLGEDRSASKVLDQVGGAADKNGSRLAKFGHAVAVSFAAAGAAVIAFGKSSVSAFKDAANESMKLSRVTGMNVADSSRLRFAAEETGVAYDTLAKSTQIFSKNLASSASDSKKSAALTKLLGFSFQDASGHVKSMNEVLPQLADKFKDMPNGPEKTRLAMQLFGKQGTEMVKLLNKGSEGLAEFAEESDKTGNTIKDTSAVQAQIKAQREFNASMKGLKITLGQALMPIMAGAAQFMAQHVGPAFVRVTQFVKDHQNVIRKLTPLIVALTVGLTGLMVLKKVTGAFSALNIVMKANPIMAVVVLLAALAAGLVYAYKHSQTFRNIVNGVFHAIAEAGKWMWENVLKPVFDAIQWAFGEIGGVASAFAGAWNTAWGAVGDGLRWVYNHTIKPVIDLIMAGINAVRDAWNWLTGSGPGPEAQAKQLGQGPRVNPGHTSGGGNSQRFNGHAHGGIFLPRAGGQIASVNGQIGRFAEAGQPEAVMPLSALNQFVNSRHGDGGDQVVEVHINLSGQTIIREIRKTERMQGKLVLSV